MKNPTEASRRTTVKSTHIFKEVFDSGNKKDGFKIIAELAGISSSHAWFVSVTSQSGTLPEAIDFHVFKSEEAAKEFAATIPAGTILENDGDAPFDQTAWESLENKNELLLRFSRAGDEDSGLPVETLWDANIYEGVHLSKMVSESLGQKRIDELQSTFGQNWEAAAAYEYCTFAFAPSSPAYIAAKQQFSYYVKNDDFSAGYLMRDLEIVKHGVEEAVIRASNYSNRQAKIAAKGGEAQAAKAADRKTMFFRIALQNLEWITKSEKEQVKFLKKLVSQKDADALFLHGDKPMSDTWFEDRISELRSSGELDRAMKKALGFLPNPGTS